MDIAVINRINNYVKPDAKNAGYSHFPKTGFVWYADYLHYLLEETPKRIRRNTPNEPNYRTNQKGMTISVRRPAELE